MNQQRSAEGVWHCGAYYPSSSTECRVLQDIEDEKSCDSTGYPHRLTELGWAWGWREDGYTYIPPWRRHDLIDTTVEYESYDRVRSLEGYRVNRDYFLEVPDVVAYIQKHGFGPVADEERDEARCDDDASPIVEAAVEADIERYRLVDCRMPSTPPSPSKSTESSGSKIAQAQLEKWNFLKNCSEAMRKRCQYLVELGVDRVCDVLKGAPPHSFTLSDFEPFHMSPPDVL